MHRDGPEDYPVACDRIDLGAVHMKTAEMFGRIAFPKPVGQSIEMVVNETFDFLIVLLKTKHGRFECSHDMRSFVRRLGFGDAEYAAMAEMKIAEVVDIGAWKIKKLSDAKP